MPGKVAGEGGMPSVKASVRERAESLFRPAALARRFSSSGAEDVLKVDAPGTATVLGTIALLALAFLAASFFVRVESIDRGRGVVQSAGAGVLVAARAGVVSEVGVRPGSRVAKGDVLVEVDPVEARLAVDIARLQLELLKKGMEHEGKARRPSTVRAQSELVRLESAVASMTDAVRQASIRAPVAGEVESISIHPHDVVAAGQRVGRVIPKDGAFTLVALVSEKSRSLVVVGDIAQLELDRFPQERFGTIPARIVRISDDLMSPDELPELLADAPYRLSNTVELEIVFGQTWIRPVDVRPGMRFSVRFCLRRQRLIGLLFRPLQRWLD
jgi:multidrug resistance efflux pump